MGRIRSVISQSPAIVISILAVALSFGGGAYASTHVSAANPAGGSNAAVTTGVTWASLSLINGWASENGAYGIGNPPAPCRRWLPTRRLVRPDAW